MQNNFKAKSFLKFALPVTTVGLIAFSILVSSFIYWSLLNSAKERLNNDAALIKRDLIFRDGKWDLALYNADNNISDHDPLYLISSEGVIIDRSRPINGFLDLTRYGLLTQYSSPTTVETVTNESWRVLTKEVYSGNYPVGAVFVSFYQPEQAKLSEIDSKLEEVTSNIHSKIRASGENIDISQVDPRDYPYTFSFQIVNRFNKVLFQSNNVNSITRMPSYIDRSFIDNQLKGERFREVKDNQTDSRFLTLTTPLINEQNLVSGIIVNAVSIDNIYSVLWLTIFLSFVIGLIISTGLMLVHFRYIKKVLALYGEKNRLKIIPKSIVFVKKDCKLIIDDEVVEIPYSSHQYYFCQALFQKPQKKWEVDELLEIFGEDFETENWRKVYDTMNALNRKTSHLIEKLFEVKNKRYFINSHLLQVSKLGIS